MYILFSRKDRQLYTGYSPDLKTRVLKHTKGYVKATKHRRLLKLIFYEAFSSKKDAKAREKFLKSGFGRTQLKKALQNELKELDYKHL